MSLQVERMPGPSPEARVLQLHQWETLNAYYAARNRQPLHQKENGPEAAAERARYDQSVKELLALLGENELCYKVDTETWETFSDAFKDENNIRPHHEDFTYVQVQAWLERYALS